MSEGMREGRKEGRKEGRIDRRKEGRKEGRRERGNVLINNALNTFYLWLYGIRHMVKDHICVMVLI